jgi:hypothetical protein
MSIVMTMCVTYYVSLPSSVREAAQLEAVVVMQRMLVSRTRDILALSLDRTFSRTSDAPEWSLHIHPSFIDTLLAINIVAQTLLLAPTQIRTGKALVIPKCSSRESSIQHHTPRRMRLPH